MGSGARHGRSRPGWGAPSLVAAAVVSRKLLMKRLSQIAGALLLLFGCVGPIQARPLMLTPVGIADGFTLSTYATGDGSAYSYLAAAPLNGSPGNLVVTDYSHGMLRKYA